MKFKPLHNAVVVEPLPEEQRYSSLLILPETALHSTSATAKGGGTVGQFMDQGRVIAVGAGYKYGRRYTPAYVGSKQGTWEDFAHEKPIALAVKPGDLVLFAHMGGEDYTEDGVLYRIISERQIEAVLESGG